MSKQFEQITVLVGPTDNIYGYYLSIINSLIGDMTEEGVYIPNPLTTRELEVFAELLNANNEYSALPVDKRALFINSGAIKKQIKDKLSLTSAGLNNIIIKLENKKFINGLPLYKAGVVNPQFNKNLYEYKGIQFTFESQPARQQQPEQVLHRGATEDISGVS
jgi:hypothetical protein